MGITKFNAVRPLCVASLALAIGLGGCSRIENQQGYLGDEILVDNIMPNIDNRQSVAATLGRPSIEGTFDDKVWYYVTQRTEQFAFLTPEPKEHKVMAVYFDEKDNVDRIEWFGLDDIASVNLKGDKTPTRGREMGVLEQIFGNIGRFSGAPGGGAPPQ